MQRKSQQITLVLKWHQHPTYNTVTHTYTHPCVYHQCYPLDAPRQLLLDCSLMRMVTTVTVRDRWCWPCWNFRLTRAMLQLLWSYVSVLLCLQMIAEIHDNLCFFNQPGAITHVPDTRTFGKGSSMASVRAGRKLVTQQEHPTQLMTINEPATFAVWIVEQLLTVGWGRS